MTRTDATATLMSCGYSAATAGSILERAERTGATVARGVAVSCTNGSYRVKRAARARRRATGRGRSA